LSGVIQVTYPLFIYKALFFTKKFHFSILSTTIKVNLKNSKSMKMNFILISLGLLLIASCSNKSDNKELKNTTLNESGFEILNFDKSELKKLKDLKGEFKHAIKWKDNNGENLFIFTLENSFIQWDMEEEGMGDFVYHINAYHFSLDGKKYQLLKNHQNLTPECSSPPFALEADFIYEAFEILDLNKDGIAEISFIYYYNCSSEINPKSYKLVFIDQNKTYSVSGSEYLKQYYPDSGKRFFGAEFKGATDEIIDFATKKWDKHFKSNPTQTKIEFE